MSGGELAWRLRQLVPDAHLIAVANRLGYAETREVRLLLAVSAGVTEGEYINRA